MDNNDTSLSCTVNMEWKNNQGTITRKFAQKSATLRMLRNESRQMFLEVSAEKVAGVKIELKNINVHKKFMAEGKSSIVFQDANCTLYLSNAPPGNLLNFLRGLFVKMTGQKADNPSNPLRNKLLSNKNLGFDEISPVTTAEMIQAREKISRATDTTPSPGSRKRKLKIDGPRGPASKKLHMQDQQLPIMNLNAEQQRVLDACVAGHNVFFTGSAGTGKSYLLKKIIAALPPAVTAATASTGVAACHIGGTTVHAFAGIGTGEGSIEKCVKVATKNGTAQLWRRTKHLIIDEISMIDGHFFTKLEEFGRRIRNNEKPFGGIQLILCGDFLQLPPVNRKGEKDVVFCFESPAWDRCVTCSYELRQVHRQTDSQFVQILNEIRLGRTSVQVVETLTRTSKQSIEENGVLATRLSSQNVDADVINQSKLAALEGNERHFIAQDSDPMYSKNLDSQTPVPGKLTLKVGAQVMLLKNLSVAAGLVNGARGVVVRFEADLPVVRFRNGKECSVQQHRWRVRSSGGVIVSRSQLPLKLAWAFSIHKAQGLTLDCVEMSLARVFEAGQAYVALSRAQSLKTLRVLDFDKKQVWANPKVLQFYNKLKRRMQIAAGMEPLIPLRR